MDKTNKEIINVYIGEQEQTKKHSISGWNAKAIEEAKIMVIGAGALGNEVLKNLALTGVKQIVLVDFDVIEKSNLAKSVLYRERDCTGDKLKVDIAAERLKEISPNIKIMKVNGDATLDIGLGIVRHMDVLIGCLDNRLARLWINRYSFMLGKSWVDGGILNLEGQVDVYSPDTNCYECGLGRKAWDQIAYRNGCINRARRYASAGLANTNSIVASIVGAIQAQEALKLIADPTHSLAGFQFFFDGKTNHYDKLGKDTPRKHNCKSHEVITSIIEGTELSANLSIQDTLTWLQHYFTDNNPTVLLPYQVITKAITGISNKQVAFIKARPHLNESDLDNIREIEDEEVRFETTDNIDSTFPNLEVPLKTIGIPHYHILTVVAGGTKHFVELTGDREILQFV